MEEERGRGRAAAERRKGAVGSSRAAEAGKRSAPAARADWSRALYCMLSTTKPLPWCAEEDAVVPAQGMMANVDTPEKRLMSAVLEDALDVCYRPDTERTGPRQAEAWEWIWSDDPRWPFSFRCICDVLGLDAGAVRGRLLHAPHRIRMPRRYGKRVESRSWSTLSGTKGEGYGGM